MKKYLFSFLVFISATFAFSQSEDGVSENDVSANNIVTEKDVADTGGMFINALLSSIVPDESLISSLYEELSQYEEGVESGELNNFNHKFNKTKDGDNSGKVKFTGNMAFAVVSDDYKVSFNFKEKFSDYSNNNTLRIDGKLQMKTVGDDGEHEYTGNLKFSGAYNGTIVLNKAIVHSSMYVYDYTISETCFIESDGKKLSVTNYFVWQLGVAIMEGVIGQ